MIINALTDYLYFLSPFIIMTDRTIHYSMYTLPYYKNSHIPEKVTLKKSGCVRFSLYIVFIRNNQELQHFIVEYYKPQYNTNLAIYIKVKIYFT